MSTLRVKELESSIREYADSYYNDEPQVSDREFDDLTDELRRLAPDSPVLKQVGAKPSNTVWLEVKHTIHMGSQLKVNTFEEFCDWANKIGVTEFCWSEKMDGSSAAIHHDEAHKQALSRGDGITGSDITPNVLKMNGGHLLSLPRTCWTRNEIIMAKKTWEDKFRDTTRNPRNAAAGIARRLDGTDCQYLDVISYGVDGVEFETEMQKFLWLLAHSFKAPNFGLAKSLEEAKVVYDSYVIWARNACAYEIDGLVFAVNDLKKQKALGMVDNRPKGQRAWKFPALGGKTTIRDVIRQTGRTGRITPVAAVDPVDIGGVTISRVSLMNYEEIRRLKIRIGDEVIVTRCNDVIPRITGVSKPAEISALIEIPTECPSCGGPTERDGVYVVCVAANSCPAQNTAHLLNFLRVIDAKGFGASMIEELKERGVLKSPIDFFTLLADDFTSAKIGKKLVAEIGRKAMKMTLPVFIDALGIHGIGQHATELAMQKFPNLGTLRKAKTEELCAISGIGPEIAAQFEYGLHNRRDLIDGLLRFITIIEPQAIEATGSKCHGFIVCFTGFRSPELEEAIQAQGGTVAPSMNKKVTHLIAKDRNSGSTKLQKAAAAGVVVWSADELFTHLG